MKIRLAVLGIMIVAATLGILVVRAAPAAIEKPEVPTFARRPLPLEWNGARPDPDLSRMFRTGAATRPDLDDMFRRR